MTTLTLELPYSVFATTRSDPEHLKSEIRLAAAASWYLEGRVSQEAAADLAGLDRTDFLLALSQHGHDSFVVDFGDLDKELAGD